MVSQECAFGPGVGRAEASCELPALTACPTAGRHLRVVWAVEVGGSCAATRCVGAGGRQRRVLVLPGSREASGPSCCGLDLGAGPWAWSGGGRPQGALWGARWELAGWGDSVPRAMSRDWALCPLALHPDTGHPGCARRPGLWLCAWWPTQGELGVCAPPSALLRAAGSPELRGTPFR